MIVNDTKDILKEYELFAKKKFGQNFITSSAILEHIIKVANITKDDYVLEIGPGLGSLTEFLAINAKAVIAYEIDTDMVNILSKTISKYNNVTIINKDFLDVDIDLDIDKLFNGANNVKVVANIPYYITTPILFKLLASNKISDMYFMMQKELGQRLSGKPKTKDYNALSVIMNYKSNAKIEFDVPRNFFFPVPNVDSILLSVKRKKNDYSVDNEDEFFRFVEALFGMRRKTIVNNLSSSKCHFDKELIKNSLNSLNLKESARAEELDLDMIIKLYKELRR
ncbi:MAG: 16S rRNA (adenine(1518)-N(6)/adenine(1519)-N(6))-dimethyltransferase RsmA [Bacilli bacterium]|nr:16S rRNA (adenine(1518)-N(6)/adenine(1519)-N(6))-dimethyltransferase RsmA [Bacilli bacterium]